MLALHCFACQQFLHSSAAGQCCSANLWPALSAARMSCCLRQHVCKLCLSIGLHCAMACRGNGRCHSISPASHLSGLAQPYSHTLAKCGPIASFVRRCLPVCAIKGAGDAGAAWQAPMSSAIAWYIVVRKFQLAASQPNRCLPHLHDCHPGSRQAAPQWETTHFCALQLTAWAVADTVSF